MRKQVNLSEMLLVSEHHMSFYEICETCSMTTEDLIQMVDYGLVNPQGKSEIDWQFEENDLLRLKRALRIKRDLEINFSGLALVLDLIEELDGLRKKVARLERQTEIR